MAAPAPSSPQQASSSSEAKGKEIAAPTHAEDAVTDASAVTLDYLSIKHSPRYAIAKQFLSSGDFDAGLSLIEEELQNVREAIEKQHVGSNSASRGSEDIDLHPALAPLYYLYGTTLLYSVEESEVMMNGDGDKDSQDQEVGDYKEENNENNDEENEASNQQDEEDEPAAADPAEDLQIAWENLDIARAILSRLVENFDPTNTNNSMKAHKSESFDDISYTPEEQCELLLDLAQIHTRLGDVQRANGNASSIEDYSRSLEIRSKLLGKFDKLVADCHYNIAKMYAEAPTKEKEREEGVKGIVAALGGGGGNSNGGGMTKEEIRDCCIKSCDHYLAFGVVFAGIIAKMCGKDAEALTKVDNEVALSAASIDGSSGGSSTHSQTLAILRQRIAKLTPLPDTDIEEFADNKDMLDEIQETLDAAEGSEEALKAVAEMKANEIRKHAGKGDEGRIEEGGVTTTIGFGTSNAVAASEAPTAASAPTMMVVKKKKKSSSTDSSAKRAKTE
ncbi:hypothetical protein HJC23_008702 [Cyclotella cryptica]|uniref:Tetratricopeptide SHNi-TPR domain-containing protein n=1 Tax=Cyclotella cryptica TaxID=29204 RepID=A0ABD3QPA5_9STRA|eukprot:CCRYP_005426-RA/>CCRYP_005426-RA protein AED:0.05 eAED:0.05 QI:59/1/1/1/1/1/2/1994/503